MSSRGFSDGLGFILLMMRVGNANGEGVFSGNTVIMIRCSSQIRFQIHFQIRPVDYY